jgi:glycerophosphoryl diester phosphodiesterase
VHERPLVIGHRGFAGRFPDNSMEGIRAAIDAGADGVEVDVRRCAEGTWVCQHDREREGREVGEWRLDELRRRGVPALAEVVAVLPHESWFYVEVKPLAAPSLTAGLAELARLLLPRAAATRLLSSSLAVLAVAAAKLPQVGRSWVIDAVPERFPHGCDLSPKHTLVERLATSGRGLHPWTVNRTGRMRELARLGVASLTTNRPDLAVEALHG